MKKIILIFILFGSFAFTTIRKDTITSIAIEPTSQLVIKGTTNVNSFKCRFDISQISNPIPLYYKVIEDKIIFEKARLVLNSHCFDCGHKGMNKDFLALLKTDDYPEIILELKEIKISPNNTSHVKAAIKLHIAGISKLYYVNLKFEENNAISAKGVLKLCIGDFNLEAPTKALGLIVVSEDIEIRFDMVFKEIDGW